MFVSSPSSSSSSPLSRPIRYGLAGHDRLYPKTMSGKFKLRSMGVEMLAEAATEVGKGMGKGKGV